MNIPWVEYWDFLQTYADLSTEDGLDLLEEYLQKQSLALCIEEAMGKLNLLSNSSHSFMYNQMDASQHNGSVSSMSNSWLMSPLEGIVESKHESMGDLDEITNEALMERLQNDRLGLANGTPLKVSGDPMRRSIRMDESFSTPVRNIYDYGRLNRSMEWSMDSSDWSSESFTGVLTPISCLSALFSKLSLLDRSRRQKRLSGGGPGCFTISCLGQGYPGIVKSTVQDRAKSEKKAESINAPSGSKEAKQMENSYIRDAKLVLGDRNQNDFKRRAESPEKKSVSFQEDESLGVQRLKNDSDENLEVKNPKTEEGKDMERNDLVWRDASSVSDTSSTADCDKMNSDMEDVELIAPAGSKIDEHESISDLISQFDKNVSIAAKDAADSSVVEMTDLAEVKCDAVEFTPKKVAEPPKKSLFGKEKSASFKPRSTALMSKSTSCMPLELNIQLELDKDKVSSQAYQSMFEILNERKNLENQRSGEKRRVIYSRDIILNLAGVDIDSSIDILVTVILIPPNATVAEMTIFPRIPFSVIHSDDYRSGDASLSKLPAMVDVNFNFGKNCVTSALAVNNRSRGKIFFVNG